ncbi:uncharacterized protein LOC128682250 [Plodia interpunctella]|uniref:uncharacterized protein LOC128682250 n=1 Tax=Plodia interpunctella TaxID=58824 RepID=UPI0023678241|nr:uncharacterized protein LOC128682250 [Plodia interpunctella]
MTLATVCRICLTTNVRSFKIEGSLQEVFEKLMSTTLHTADGRPVAGCYMCYAQLNKCLKLMLTSARAENMLNHILHKHSEITSQSVSQLDLVANSLYASFNVTNMEYYYCTSLLSAPFVIKTEYQSEELDFDHIPIVNDHDDSQELPPLVQIDNMQFDINKNDTNRQVQDSDRNIKKESALKDREGSNQALDAETYNMYDIKFDIDEDNLINKVQLLEKDKYEAMTVRERQDSTPVKKTKSYKQKKVIQGTGIRKNTHAWTIHMQYMPAKLQTIGRHK